VRIIRARAMLIDGLLIYFPDPRSSAG